MAPKFVSLPVMLSLIFHARVKPVVGFASGVLPAATSICMSPLVSAVAVIPADAVMIASVSE